MKPLRDQADRDAIASPLMRYRDENGQRWADVVLPEVAKAG